MEAPLIKPVNACRGIAGLAMTGYSNGLEKPLGTWNTGFTGQQTTGRANSLKNKELVCAHFRTNAWREIFTGQ
jgi:hypothetical protein